MCVCVCVCVCPCVLVCCLCSLSVCADLGFVVSLERIKHNITPLPPITHLPNLPQVPTPQRLSQISSSSPHTSPQRSGVSSATRRDLTPSFAERMKAQTSQRERRWVSRCGHLAQLSLTHTTHTKGTIHTHKRNYDSWFCDVKYLSLCTV